MDSYAVIGLGRFGRAMALSLMENDCEVMAIDINEEFVQRIADHVTDAVVADARDAAVLRNLGITNYDCVVVAIGADVAASILITMMLNEMGVSRVVCKAADEVHKKALLRIGADRVIIPEKEMAVRFAQSLASPNVMDYIEISDSFAIVERNVPEMWVGKTLRDLNVRAKYSISIIAFRRKKEMMIAPHPDEPMRSDDVLIMLGKEVDLTRISKL